MPWRSSSVPAQRLEFVRLAESGRVPFSELCHRFGIGRSTGYKWLERFNMEGPVGLLLHKWTLFSRWLAIHQTLKKFIMAIQAFLKMARQI